MTTFNPFGKTPSKKGKMKIRGIGSTGEMRTWLALEQMFRFVGGDVADGGEYVGTMRGGTLNTIAIQGTRLANSFFQKLDLPMVNSTLSCFMVAVKVLEVVVKVDRAGAKVTAEEGCVGGEDGGDVDVALAAERNGDSDLPLVEVGNDRCLLIARDIL